MQSTHDFERMVAESQARSVAALTDERVTREQRATVMRLANGKRVTYAEYAPFDLPPNYLLVEVGGYNYGIGPTGEASS